MEASGVLRHVSLRPWIRALCLWVRRKPAFLDDEVIAETVLEKIAGARSFYNTVIRRGEDVLAEVKSMWCCIDAESLRPARISRDVAETFFGLPRKQEPFADE